MAMSEFEEIEQLRKALALYPKEKEDGKWFTASLKAIQKKHMKHRQALAKGLGASAKAHVKRQYFEWTFLCEDKKLKITKNDDVTKALEKLVAKQTDLAGRYTWLNDKPLSGICNPKGFDKGCFYRRWYTDETEPRTRLRVVLVNKDHWILQEGEVLPGWKEEQKEEEGEEDDEKEEEAEPAPAQVSKGKKKVPVAPVAEQARPTRGAARNPKD